MEKILEGKKKRSPYWDNIKGVLIILVVFAHCLYDLQSGAINNIIVDAIYFFHMPAFVFVSGYFSKSERSRSRQSILQLLISYVIIMVPFIVQAIFRGKEPNMLKPYYSAWYLLALVAWRLITPYLAKFKHIMPAMIAFTILVGFWENINGESALSVNKIVTFWPYFMAGYLLKPQTVEEKIKGTKAPFRILCSALIVAIGLVLEAVSYYRLHMSGADLLPNEYRAYNLEEPLSRIAVMIVSALFITSLLLMSVDRKIPILTTVGKNSLTIYLFHRMPTMIFSKHVSDMRQLYQILLAVACTLVIALAFGNNFVSKYVNLFIGNSARSISFPADEAEDERKKNKAYRIITISLLTVLFVAPIVAGFIN